jgi:hypothetical protein
MRIYIFKEKYGGDYHYAVSASSKKKAWSAITNKVRNTVSGFHFRSESEREEFIKSDIKFLKIVNVIELYQLIDGQIIL